jgi:restriction system protein
MGRHAGSCRRDPPRDGYKVRVSDRGDDRSLYVSTGGYNREARYEAERTHIPVTLFELAELFVQHYEAIDADGRAFGPLKRVIFPA